jgi:hypothetical protein
MKKGLDDLDECVSPAKNSFDFCSLPNATAVKNF